MTGKINNLNNLGCSIVTVTINNKIYFCNNEDERRPKDGTFILFVPPQEVPNKAILPDVEGTSEIYGFSLVGSKYDDGLYPQGGINSEGLCYDINGLPSVTLNKKKKGNQWKCTMNFFDLLWTNKTIKDIINWFETYEFPFPDSDVQIHFADAFGNAAIISTNKDNELVFTEKGSKKYLVSTNFNVANTDNAYFYPCKRFDAATEVCEKLVKKNDVSVADCEEILKASHVEYKNEAGTLYSNIFDLNEKKIYLYHIGNFDQRVEFNLAKELVFKDVESEVDKYTIGYYFKPYKYQFDGMRIYTISKLFEK
jgi:hypothetical protein